MRLTQIDCTPAYTLVFNAITFIRQNTHFTLIIKRSENDIRDYFFLFLLFLSRFEEAFPRSSTFAPLSRFTIPLHTISYGGDIG